MSSMRLIIIVIFFLGAKPLLGHSENNPLLPKPQTVHYGAGYLPVSGLEIAFASAPTGEDRFAANELASGLESRAKVAVRVSDRMKSRSVIVLKRTGSGAELPQPDEKPGPDSREAYAIGVTPERVEIAAKTSAGLFYGVQTLLQLVEGSTSKAVIPEVEVDDWPSLAYRGTMVDMSHGPLPREEEIKRQIDFLARWKNNQYFFYSETSIEMEGYPLVSPRARYTAEQVRRIIDYARQRHVDVVPCVELYGHLHDLFRVERYSDLAVLPHGQDFNANDHRVMTVVRDWVDQLVRLFPSPFMHIGFDEPYDIEKSSRLTGIPPSQLYLSQLTQVVQLVQQHDKRVLFWADTVNVFGQHPELIPKLPPGVIAVPWHDFIEKDYTPWFAPWAAHHIPAIESTYVHNCLSIFPEYDYTFKIIDSLLETGRKYGIVGQLINLWTDDNQDLYRMAWAGMAYGAAAAWQSGPMDRGSFFLDYARIVYPPAVALEVAPALQALSDAEMRLERIFGEETMTRIWEDPFSTDHLKLYRANRDELRQVRLLAEQGQEHIQKALALKGDPDSLASLDLGAQLLDYAGMKFLYALEISDSWQQMGTHPSRQLLGDAMKDLCNGCLVHFPAGDLMDTITELREDYRGAWLAEYTPFRLGSSLGKFDREYFYWYGFSRWIRDLETNFREGDLLPPLESYRLGY